MLRPRRTRVTSGNSVRTVSAVPSPEALSTTTTGGRGSSELRCSRVRRSSSTRSRVATTTETGDRVVSDMVFLPLHILGGGQALPPGRVLVHVVGESVSQSLLQTDGGRPAESLLRTGEV